MTSSALFMGALGIAASFLPQEILARAGAAPAPLAVLLVQIAGALYLGSALTNWTARGVLIGGVYARPLALGNFLHFAAVSIALVKQVPELRSAPVAVLTVAYAVFAVWFGLVLFTHSVKAASREPS